MLQTALRCPQAQHMWLLEEPRLLNDKMCHLRLSQQHIEILEEVAGCLPELKTEFCLAHETVFELGIGEVLQLSAACRQTMSERRQQMFDALLEPRQCFLHHDTSKVLETQGRFAFDSGWYLSSLESYLYTSLSVIADADVYHRFAQNDLLSLLMDLALFEMGSAFELFAMVSKVDAIKQIEEDEPTQQTVRVPVQQRPSLSLSLQRLRGRSEHTLSNSELIRDQQSVLANELAYAIEHQQICLYFQPKYDLFNRKLAGLEALVRWQHPVRGLVPPAEFIPLAEETGQIMELGKTIFLLACDALYGWRQMNLEIPPIAVNVSPHQFSEPQFTQFLIDAVARYRLQGKDFSLELTESVFVNDEETLKSNLLTLKAHGFSLALDDFGTGYSALSYLRQLPFDFVKVDQSFVAELPENTGDVAITKAVIAMAHSLGLTVIAEGVENEAQLRFLHSLQCDQIQGYFYARPMPSDTLLEWMAVPPILSELLNRPQNTKSLLLVDDEANILSSLKRLLRRDGYQIFTCESGAEGLRVLEQQKIDVIISDQRMPEMTGVEFLREAKRLYPDTVRIILSGYSEIRYITEAVNEGAIYKFLSKPWEDEILRQNIADAFQFKAMIDENQRLNDEIQHRNNDLAKMNRQLSDLSKLQAHQLELDRVNIQVIDEILHQLPFPIIGVSDDQHVAFCNEAALRKLWPGLDLYEQELSDLDLELAHHLQMRQDSGQHDIIVGERNYRVAWKRMGKLSPSAGVMLMFLPRSEHRESS